MTEDERTTLQGWLRKNTTEQRMARRAPIVLDAAAGKATKVIALSSQLGEGTVSKWCTRFVNDRLAGVADAPRTGKPTKYDRTTERRILAQLDQAPPEGYTTWTGGLVAQVLEDVSADHVWRVLRQHGVSLQRRRSWCLSTDPQFAQKADDIVRLYLNPLENAVVISVDEKPAIQALERARGGSASPMQGHCGGIPMNTSGMAPPTCSPRWRSAREPFMWATTVASGAVSSWTS